MEHKNLSWLSVSLLAVLVGLSVALSLVGIARAAESTGEPNLYYVVGRDSEQAPDGSTEEEPAESEADLSSQEIEMPCFSSFSELDDSTERPVGAVGGQLIALRVQGTGSTEVSYRVKSSDSDWCEWASGGEEASIGGAISVIQIKLSDADSTYHIVYRVHVDGRGWLGWAADGNSAGCEASVLDADGVDIALVAASDDAFSSSLASQESKAYLDNTSDVETGNDGAPQDDDNLSAGGEAGIELDGTGATMGLMSKSANLGQSDVDASSPSVTYQTHIQDYGWQEWVSDGTTSGTTGKSLRVEALSIKVANVDGGISYRSHVQDVGWQGWVEDGAVSGTTGRSLRVEAIQMSLTGAIADQYDIYYRTHVQDIGWTSWSKNGEVSGTTGRSLRIEAVQVLLVKHGQPVPTDDGASYTQLVRTTYATPTVRYQAHVQQSGWQSEVADGETAGTTGRSLRVEGLRFTVAGVDGGIEYRAHVQDVGWQGWVQDGSLAGTVGQGLRVEAIQLRLTGDAEQSYDIYYRVHVADIGWMAWAKDGSTAGSIGLSRRVEAVQVVLVGKDSQAPSADGSVVAYAAVVAPKISYAVNVSGEGWLSNESVESNATEESSPVLQFKASLGTEAGFGGISYRVSTDGSTWEEEDSNGGVSGGAEASIMGIRARLTGDAASYYDIWYRVYVSGVGWFGWTRNDGYAGTDVPSNSISAVQMVVLKKGSSAPGSTVKAFAHAAQLNGIDIASYQAGIDVGGVDADFVFVKATEGTWYKNQSSTKGYSYKDWANDVLDSGKLLGFYHYAEGGNAIEEADYFYNAIKDYKGKAIIALDWEGQGNDLFGGGADVLWCKTFLDRIASLLDAKPLIYMSKATTRAYDWRAVASSYPLWVAQYPNYKTTGYKVSPWTDGYSFGAWSSPMVFQYSATGRVSGYSQDLDLDLFYGTADEWRALQ